MRLTIFGSGYVGLVTGACFADVGNDVLCVDVDARKVAALQAGQLPIHEPGLDILIERNAAARRLRFTTDAAAAIAHGQLLVIAVGTPPGEDGSADLSHVLAVAREIGRHVDGYRVVIDKSTVPVGTADRVREQIEHVLRERGVTGDFDVVSNPEFLKEGAAIADFMKPDRVVIGTESPRAIGLLRQLYAPFTRNHELVHERACGYRDSGRCRHRESATRYRLRLTHRLFVYLSRCRLWRFVLSKGCESVMPHSH
jgi:UDPglucose 6-dehydrogenase